MEQKFEITFEFRKENEVEIAEGVIMHVLMRGWEGMGGCQLLRKIEVKKLND